MTRSRVEAARAGVRATQLGLLLNTALVAVKLVAGVVGHAYALVADAVESMADIGSSLIVWGGLHVATLPPDEDHPYGHGKAEALAGAVVSLMLLGAAAGIAVNAVREIRTPHTVPAVWTLAVLVAVMAVKFWLSRRVKSVGHATGSTAVKADAWHHMSDALTSGAAFIGISIAVVGSRLDGRAGWATADDWAALFASGVIGINAVLLVRPALDDLMDRTPDEGMIDAVRTTAEGVPGVLAVETLHARKSGLAYLVDIHVEASPELPLREAHILSGKVKHAIISVHPQVARVLVHMEPHVPAHPGDGDRRRNG